jgi:hypothetical protein
MEKKDNLITFDFQKGVEQKGLSKTDLEKPEGIQVNIEKGSTRNKVSNSIVAAHGAISQGMEMQLPPKKQKLKDLRDFLNGLHGLRKSIAYETDYLNFMKNDSKSLDRTLMEAVLDPKKSQNLLALSDAIDSKTGEGDF